MIADKRDTVVRQLSAVSVFVLVIGGILLTMMPGVIAGDPSGDSTYTSSIEGLEIAINFVWVLVAGFLVFFMQAGFALVGVGAIRAKNAVNYLAKSYMDFSLGAIAFLVVGFAFMFGGSEAAPGLELGNAFIGYSGWLLAGEAYDVTTNMLFLFQAMFAATAATIVAGAMAGRTKFQAYLIYTVIVTAVIYPIYGHWVWGGGWLSTLPYGAGALDFAGGTVVHISSGFSALALALVIGKRRGFGEEPMGPHNIPLTLLGAALLWFGWFGFNGGSALAANGLAANAFVVTNTSAAAGALGWMAANWMHGKPSSLGVVSGAIAGLVGITPAAGFVTPMASIVIGLVAGVICYRAMLFRIKIGLDESLDAWAIHGVGGLWGALAQEYLQMKQWVVTRVCSTAMLINS